MSYEIEDLAEMVEIAEENAYAELGVFGCVESPFDTADSEDWDDSECYRDEGYNAWHTACEDILEVTGEFATDEVFGLVD